MPSKPRAFDLTITPQPRVGFSDPRLFFGALTIPPKDAFGFANALAACNLAATRPIS